MCTCMRNPKTKGWNDLSKVGVHWLLTGIYSSVSDNLPLMYHFLIHPFSTQALPVSKCLANHPKEFFG